MTARSALDIIWARINEAIGGKVASAADSADEAERQAGVATSEAKKAKAEADRARAEAAAEVDKLTAGAPEAFDTLKEISDELERNETERAALATTIGKKADADHEHAVSDLTDYPGHTVLLGHRSYGKIPLRESDTDDLRVPNTPTESYHATSKLYVDGQVAKKADADHEHAVSDLTDYPGHTVLLGHRSYGKIPLRESDTDDLRVPNTPTESYHATSKLYVDGQVAKKADASYVDQELSKKADTEAVNKRPALFHGHGPPGTIEGAVPGDKYMDLDEMEIYLLKEENVG